LKIKTPKIAVATSSILSQIETEAAFAALSPTISKRGPRNPPKKIIPSVFDLLPDLKSIWIWLPRFKMKGIIANAAPR